MADKRAQHYGEKLSRLIRMETVSVRGQHGGEKFTAFRKLLEEKFPLLFSRGDCKVFQGGFLLRWKGTDASRAPILLMNHHDVVEANGVWKYPPFSGTVAEDRVWGRGTLDTKGGLCTMLCSGEELMAEGYVPNRDVYFLSTCTEETDGYGCREIVAYLQEQGIRFDLVLDEGGMILHDPIGGADGVFAMIGVGEKGFLNLKFTARSKGGHASAPGKDTPLVRLGKFMAEAEKGNIFPTEISPAVKEMLSRFAPTMKGVMKLACGHTGLFGPVLRKVMPALSPAAEALLRTTLAFTMCGGSEGANVLPGEAWVIGNMRYSHHQGRDASLEAITRLAAKYEIETTLLEDGGESPITDHNKEGFRFLSKAVEETFPGVIPVPYVTTGASDCRYLSVLSDNCLRFVPFHIDKQQYGSVHGEDENVNLSCLPKAVDFYRYVITRWKTE
ncbi:MAG: M20/M25/M40 family metallo-hydrolase [Ruminococcaceae bacterium]|nr:M20/M25/M40 family metallo-hydrolase [Oscillospiraceae bacterium]